MLFISSLLNSPNCVLKKVIRVYKITLSAKILLYILEIVRSFWYKLYQKPNNWKLAAVKDVTNVRKRNVLFFEYSVKNLF